MQFEAHANIRRGHRHPVRHRVPVGPNLSLHLPRPDRLVIVADGPEAEDSDGAACPPTRAARHRDDAVDSKEGGALERALQCALSLGAGAGVRLGWLAGRTPSRTPSRRGARSSRAASTEARSGTPVVIAAWNARSSFRKGSS